MQATVEAIGRVRRNADGTHDACEQRCRARAVETRCAGAAEHGTVVDPRWVDPSNIGKHCDEGRDEQRHDEYAGRYGPTQDRSLGDALHTYQREITTLRSV